jgi:hypothetical protein
LVEIQHNADVFCIDEKHGKKIGLHFWTMLPGGTAEGIVYATIKGS